MGDNAVAKDRGGEPACAGVAAMVERAFHYRGDVTVVLRNGESITGFLFNRSAGGHDPFAHLFVAGGDWDIPIPYRDIARVLFTGADAAVASARRFTAFRKRRAGKAPAHGPAPRKPGDRHES